MAGPNLRKFQMRVAEIERDAAAGLIGNEMRRSLLIQARDQYGMTNLGGRNDNAHRTPTAANANEPPVTRRRNETDKQYLERLKAAKARRSA